MALNYTIQVGETRPVLDADGNPISSAGQPGLPFGPGLAATMYDQGGVLVCTGNFPGTLPFIVYGPAGASVAHDVTVEGTPPSPFDWSLGDPI